MHFCLRRLAYRAADIGGVRQWCLALALMAFPATTTAQHQLTLAPMNLLPKAPSTYHMRDWRQVALDFDALAFDVDATGQFLPIPVRDDTPESPFLTVAYKLPSYVGDNRFYGNGEPFAEGIPTLGAVLGSTLMGIDKSAGPINWVSMTREYYINRNNEFIMMNRTDSRSGGSAWYDIFPNILFYAIADRYPNETYLNSIQNQIDAKFFTAVNVLTSGGTNPNFHYTGYDFSDNVPRSNNVCQVNGVCETNMGLGMAWMQHAAYWRNRESFPSVAALHLQAVDWALAYYEDISFNPHYEVLTAFGAYGAARMNAEHDRNYNIHKYLDWVFSRSDVRRDLIMISGEQWGGQDVGGLMGGMRPCCTNPVQGYAFAMNTYVDAMAVVPIARYEDRYARDIGKWILNAASAARLFYGNFHPPGNQSSEFWTGDPNYAIAYEGLRHHWLPPHLLAPGENPEIYAAGDPLTYGWGPLTDFGIYGSAFVGALGSVVRTTNVERILQIDLLATDFYRDTAHLTYLYYNPHSTVQSVAIDLGSTQQFDLYDAVSNRFLKRGVSGETFFDVPKENAVILVLVPAGGTATMVGRKLVVDDVVIDYNATLLPDNLLRNPDVDTPVLSTATTPSFWHRSLNARWSSSVALSPTRSLELPDTSTTRAEEWRSYATQIPKGEGRVLDLRWFWNYAIDSGDEFLARLRLSTQAVSGVDLLNPTAEMIFPISGASNGFEMFETSVAIDDMFRSFDLTFISGSAVSALGSMFIDDISVALRTVTTVLAGDHNGNGTVDAADYTVWRDGLGTIHTAEQYELWKQNFGATVGSATALGSSSHATVPEPASLLMLVLCAAMLARWRCGERVC